MAEHIIPLTSTIILFGISPYYWFPRFDHGLYRLSNWDWKRITCAPSWSTSCAVRVLHFPRSFKNRRDISLTNLITVMRLGWGTWLIADIYLDHHAEILTWEKDILSPRSNIQGYNVLWHRGLALRHSRNTSARSPDGSAALVTSLGLGLGLGRPQLVWGALTLDSTPSGIIPWRHVIHSLNAERDYSWALRANELEISYHT